MATITPDPFRIVLFDGVCQLCSSWARFLLRFDRQAHFKLASVQSEAGQALLTRYGFPTDYFTTLLYIEHGQVYTHTAAVIRIVRQLSFPWPLFATILAMIPRPVRDWLYKHIALNRYRLFGKRDTCFIPTAAHRERFLTDIDISLTSHQQG